MSHLHHDNTNKFYPALCRTDLLSDLIPLGFGTGWLQTEHKEEATKTVETALECGFNYFDTARLYSNGQAEALLGTILPPHRSRIVLTSKLGIAPVDMSLKGKIRQKLIKSAREPEFGKFQPDEITQSLETSLTKLKTDYLDILLLHECTAEHLQRYDVIPLLDKLKQSGKIRYYGIATNVEESQEILTHYPALRSVVQIPSNAVNKNIETIRKHHPLSFTITHSILSTGLKPLRAYLEEHASEKKVLQDTLNFSLETNERIAQLLISHALYSNPEGVVLFFSTNSENIRRARDIVKKDKLTSERMALFEQFIETQFAASPYAQELA